MSLIQYGGICNFCGRKTEAGKGDFQSIGSLNKKERTLFTGANFKSKWLIRCFRCKGKKHTLKFEELNEAV